MPGTEGRTGDLPVASWNLRCRSGLQLLPVELAGYPATGCTGWQLARTDDNWLGPANWLDPSQLPSGPASCQPVQPVAGYPVSSTGNSCKPDLQRKFQLATGRSPVLPSVPDM